MATVTVKYKTSRGVYFSSLVIESAEYAALECHRLRHEGLFVKSRVIIGGITKEHYHHIAPHEILLVEVDISDTKGNITGAYTIAE